MIDGRFLVGLTGLVAVALVAAWPLAERFDGGPGGLAAGLGFAWLNLAVGHHWIRRSVTRGGTSFVAAVLGGSAARILGVALFAVVVATATRLDPTVALVATLAAHLGLGLAELLYLNRTDALR